MNLRHQKNVHMAFYGIFDSPYNHCFLGGHQTIFLLHQLFFFSAESLEKCTLHALWEITFEIFLQFLQQQ